MGEKWKEGNWEQQRQMASSRILTANLSKIKEGKGRKSLEESGKTL